MSYERSRDASESVPERDDRSNGAEDLDELLLGVVKREVADCARGMRVSRAFVLATERAQTHQRRREIAADSVHRHHRLVDTT